MARKFRRVLTGHDVTGKSIVVADGAAPNVQSDEDFGIDVTHLWLTHETPANNQDDRDYAVGELPVQPPQNGTAFRILELRPGESKTTRDWRPGSNGDNRSHPFMHRTATVDYQVVLKGEVVMLLDNSEVVLKAGDCVVQRGTNHAWVNRSQEPCFIVAVQLDAKPL